MSDAFLSRRLWILFAVEFAVFAGLLFGAAGTLFWASGWWTLLLFFGCSIGLTWRLARRDPSLLAERLKPVLQPGQPVWDKIFLITMIIVWCAWFILMGMDAVRYGWSVVPSGLQWAGTAGFVGVHWLLDQTMAANTFLAPVVRIQRERDHQVISTGPYAVVRHPMYAAMLVYLPSMALMLGSWYGFGMALVMIVGMTSRIFGEEHELREHLKGYREYMDRVPYRLIPGVW